MDAAHGANWQGELNRIQSPISSESAGLERWPKHKTESINHSDPSINVERSVCTYHDAALLMN